MMKPCDASPACLHETCDECDRPIRNTTQPFTEHPGTVPGIKSRGLCITHRRHVDGERAPDTPLDRIRHDNNMRGLGRFLAARHQRLGRRSRV